MPIQLSVSVLSADNKPCGDISRLIANQSNRQIESAVIRLKKGQEIVVPASSFSDVKEGGVRVDKNMEELESMPPFNPSRYYHLHPVEWQKEWGVVGGEILTLFPPQERDIRSRRRFIIGSMAIVGGVALSLAYPLFRYLIHPLTRRLSDLWVSIKLRGQLREDTPTLVTYSVDRVEGYLERIITKGLWLIRPSKKLALQIASRRENMSFPSVGWSNRPDDPVAFSTKCPHLGCNVRWVAENNVFWCACHDSRFELNGSWISGPAPRGLDTLPVRTDREKIEVMDMEFRAGIAQKKRVS